MNEDAVAQFLPTDEAKLLVAPVLSALEDQASNADRTRTIASEVTESLRGSDVMRMDLDFINISI